LRSRTFAAELSPTLSSAFGVNSATWWQTAQSTLTKSPRPKSSIRAPRLLWRIVLWSSGSKSPANPRLLQCCASTGGEGVPGPRALCPLNRLGRSALTAGTGAHARGSVKRRSPTIIEQFTVAARAMAWRIFRIPYPKSNRIACFRKGGDFSHGLGRWPPYARRSSVMSEGSSQSACGRRPVEVLMPCNANSMKVEPERTRDALSS